MAKQYETVIGLEVHVELSTKTKIFCGCPTQFGGAVNEHTCPVCTGMPGSLPVLNKKVVEHAVALGLATNCSINKYCRFDRKNYFYPDNPQNYQISQLYVPICKDGSLEIEWEGENDTKNISTDKNGTYSLSANISTEDKTTNKITNNRVMHKKSIRIHEMHMEEDAGKLTHNEEEGISLVDYNRSGVPLIEIVSEPDMRSAKEVIAYLEKLRMICQYLGISDCKLQEGSMRVDVNLSVREKCDNILGKQKECLSNVTDKERMDFSYNYDNSDSFSRDWMKHDENGVSYGTRTEMKNLNSFRAITHAIESEQKRQIELIERGEKVTQETRRWDENKEMSFTMRSKEDANDYRYFPEPDLMPVKISDDMIENIRRDLPEFAPEKYERYKKEYGLSDYDAGILTQNRHMADMFEETAKLCDNPKKVANWYLGEVLRILKERAMDPEELTFSPKNLAAIIKAMDDGKINQDNAKKVFAKVFDEDIEPLTYMEEHGLMMVSDTGAIEAAVDEVLVENPATVEEYHSGKDRVFGFLVGQVMKKMKGKGDPAKVNEVLREKL